MIQVLYYPDEHKPVAQVVYPKRARMQPIYCEVINKEHAITLWHIRSKKYIFETLRAWTLQRKNAIRHVQENYKTVGTAKEPAYNRIMLMLLSHYESPLPLLAMRVAQSRKDIECIAPSAHSSLLKHYEEVIKPIVDWCEMYDKDVNALKVSNN